MSPTPAPHNLASLLLEHPFADGEGLLFTDDRSMSAGEARAAARETAAALRALGVRAGQAVALRVPDGVDFIPAMAGIWLAGCVLVPVNDRLPDAEVSGIMRATEPSALVSATGTHMVGDGRSYEPGAAFVLWTSGTTGAPKPILHTHEAYLELLDRVLVPLRGSRTTDRSGDARSAPTPNLIPVTLSLSAGLYNALFGLRAGSALVIMKHFEPSTFAGLVRRFAIRSTVLPPAAMVSLVEASEVRDLSPLRYVRSITAPLSPLQARRFSEKFGTAVLNGYGQSEIGEVIGWTGADARSHPEKLGAVGRPHPGVDVKVIDESGSALGRGEIGELLVRAPRMAAGYATGEALSERLDPEGYLRTGDLARIDDDGFVWVEGRASDVIIRGGHKVFPEQVEEVLRLSGHIADAAVAGVPDDRLGEVPVAFVVTTGPVDHAALQDLCREHLAPYKVPVSFRRVDALPRSEVGKILRRQLATCGAQPGEATRA